MWTMRIILGMVWIWSLSLIIGGSMLIGANKLLNQSPWLIIFGLVVNAIVIQLYSKNEFEYADKRGVKIK